MLIIIYLIQYCVIVVVLLLYLIRFIIKDLFILLFKILEIIRLFFLIRNSCSKRENYCNLIVLLMR